MIVTHTFVECDSCGQRVLGCTDLNSSESNRMMNALAVARLHGWRREWQEKVLKDYCRSCWTRLFAHTREDAK